MRWWFSLVTWGKRTPTSSWTNVLGPLFHSHANHVTQERWGRLLGVLGGYDRSPEHSRTWLFPFFSHSWDDEYPASYVDGNGVESDRNSLSLALLFKRTRADRVVLDRTVEVPERFRDPQSGNMDLSKVENLEPESDAYKEMQDYLERAGRPVKYRHHRFWPFYGYERTAGREHTVGRERKFHLFFLLYQSRHDQHWDPDKKKYEQRVERRVLWKFYHYRRTGDKATGKVSVDIFPGITYDRQGTHSKTVAWLWRVFRYERRGARKRLYFLFFPVMTWGPRDAAAQSAAAQEERTKTRIATLLNPTRQFYSGAERTGGRSSMSSVSLHADNVK